MSFGFAQIAPPAGHALFFQAAVDAPEPILGFRIEYVDQTGVAEIEIKGFRLTIGAGRDRTGIHGFLPTLGAGQDERFGDQNGVDAVLFQIGDQGFGFVFFFLSKGRNRCNGRSGANK